MYKFYNEEYDSIENGAFIPLNVESLSPFVYHARILILT